MINWLAASTATRGRALDRSPLREDVLRQFRIAQNYVHAYQVTGSEFFASVARDIVRWWTNGSATATTAGFTPRRMPTTRWTTTATTSPGPCRIQAVLTEAEAAVAGLHYDVNEVGEMHHNPKKMFVYPRFD